MSSKEDIMSEIPEEVKLPYTRVHALTADSNSQQYKLFIALPLDYHKSEDTMWMWRNLQKNNLVPCGRSNLQTVANHFQIDYSKAHDALADCHITAKVYHELINITHNLKNSNF